MASSKVKLKRFLGPIIAFIVFLMFVYFIILPSVLRNQYSSLYMSRLDDWTNKGAVVSMVQAQVVEPCGMLVLTQAGAIDRIKLMTTSRDEFDFRVDVCTKMTVNRVYKQPEFEKPETVALICDGSNELFRRLCQRSGLRPASQ